MHYARWWRHGDTSVNKSIGPKTDKPAYFTKHMRVKRARGSASQFLCEGCCGGAARDWAWIHGRDGLDMQQDFVPLCKRCHALYDGIIGRKKSPEAVARGVATRRANGNYGKKQVC